MSGWLSWSSIWSLVSAQIMISRSWDQPCVRLQCLRFSQSRCPPCSCSFSLSPRKRQDKNKQNQKPKTNKKTKRRAAELTFPLKLAGLKVSRWEQADFVLKLRIIKNKGEWTKHRQRREHHPVWILQIIRNPWIQVRKAIKLSWFKSTELGTRSKVILTAL